MMNDTIQHVIDGFTSAYAGESLPYVMANDLLITTLLILSFILLLWTMTRHNQLLKKRTSDFFFSLTDKAEFSPDNNLERGVKFFIVVNSLVLLSILTLYYCQNSGYINVTNENSYLLLGKFFLVYSLFLFLKLFLYAIVNGTFFKRNQNKRWMKSLYFIIFFAGALFFPIAAMAVYLDFLSPVITILTILAVTLFEILIIFKLIRVFFLGKYKLMLILLYLCTVEIIPLLLIGRVVMLLIKT